MWLRWLFILPIRLYQKFISPWLRPSCRYYPTCSHFSVEAIDRYGVIVGTVKSVARILRCHPLFPGGYDPVDTAWPRIGRDRHTKTGV